MTASIRVRHASKVFPETIIDNRAAVARYLADDDARRSAGVHIAVRDVSFNVEDGERIGIIGANGAGKTTLVRMLAGLSLPSAGDIAVEGSVHAILTIGSSLREEMTGRDNLMLALQVGGSQVDIAAKLDEMISFAELDDVIDWPVRTYSSGMKARLSFASAIVVDPDILIIDEALSVGDQKFSAKATAAMRQLCNRGRVVIIVSHAMEAIASMCDRCIWMDGGRIVMDGASRDVITAYETDMRKRFEKAALETTKQSDEIFDPRVSGMTPLTAEIVSMPADAKGKMPRKVFQAKFDMTLAATVADLEFTLEIERLDAIVVSRDRVRCPDEQAPGTLVIEVEAPNFHLNSGVYLIAIDVSSGGTRLARLAGQVAIQSEMSFGHGHPTVAWPASVTAGPVQGSSPS